MAVTIRVTVQGGRALEREFRKLSNEIRVGVRTRFLRKAAFVLQEDASANQIKRGGSGPPLRDRLTSRTGTLRRSIASNRGRDESRLPDSIDVGTELVYGAVHETGGLVRRPASTRSGGVRVRAHTARYPRRPFLEPAIEATLPRMRRILEDEMRRALA